MEKKLKMREFFGLNVKFLIVVGIGFILMCSFFLPHNLDSIIRAKNVLSVISFDQVQRFNQSCDQVPQRLIEKNYQEVVNLAYPVWSEMPDVYLKITNCRARTEELAFSLQLLKREPEAEAVYQKAISIYPDLQDWIAYFARVGLGDIDLKRKEWLGAIEDYADAYDIAVANGGNVGHINEERIWNRIEILLDQQIKEEPDNDIITQLLKKVAASHKSGLWIVIGQSHEKAHRFKEALSAYQQAYELAMHSSYLPEHILKLR